MRQWRLSLRNFRQSNQLVAGFEVHTGNAAATLSYVADPIGDTTIPLHILWDSNALRTPSLDAVDGAAREFREKYPRSSYPELQANPVNSPDFFRKWAKESHQVRKTITTRFCKRLVSLAEATPRPKICYPNP
jgi:hypothetical protein